MLAHNGVSAGTSDFDGRCLAGGQNPFKSRSFSCLKFNLYSPFFLSSSFSSFDSFVSYCFIPHFLPYYIILYNFFIITYFSSSFSYSSSSPSSSLSSSSSYSCLTPHSAPSSFNLLRFLLLLCYRLLRVRTGAAAERTARARHQRRHRRPQSRVNVIDLWQPLLFVFVLSVVSFSYFLSICVCVFSKTFFLEIDFAWHLTMPRQRHSHLPQ